MLMAAEALQSGDPLQIDGVWTIVRRVWVGAGRVVVTDAEGKEHIYRDGGMVITKED